MLSAIAQAIHNYYNATSVTKHISWNISLATYNKLFVCPLPTNEKYHTQNISINNLSINFWNLYSCMLNNVHNFSYYRLKF